MDIFHEAQTILVCANILHEAQTLLFCANIFWEARTFLVCANILVDAKTFCLRKHFLGGANLFGLRKHFLGGAILFGLRKHFSWCANLFILSLHQLPEIFAVMGILGPRGFASLSGGVELSGPFSIQPYFRSRMHTFSANELIVPSTQHFALNVTCKCDWFYSEIYFKTKDKNSWKFCPSYYILINIGLLWSGTKMNTCTKVHWGIFNIKYWTCRYWSLREECTYCRTKDRIRL